MLACAAWVPTLVDWPLWAHSLTQHTPHPHHCTFFPPQPAASYPTALAFPCPRGPQSNLLLLPCRCRSLSTFVSAHRARLWSSAAQAWCGTTSTRVSVTAKEGSANCNPLEEQACLEGGAVDSHVCWEARTSLVWNYKYAGEWCKTSTNRCASCNPRTRLNKLAEKGVLLTSMCGEVLVAAARAHEPGIQVQVRGRAAQTASATFALQHKPHHARATH